LRVKSAWIFEEYVTKIKVIDIESALIKVIDIESALRQTLFLSLMHYTSQLITVLQD
jgi:hypothetical protein